MQLRYFVLTVQFVDKTLMIGTMTSIHVIVHFAPVVNESVKFPMCGSTKLIYFYFQFIFRVCYWLVLISSVLHDPYAIHCTYYKYFWWSVENELLICLLASKSPLIIEVRIIYSLLIWHWQAYLLEVFSSLV